MKGTKIFSLVLLILLLLPMATNAALMAGVTGTGGTVIDTANNKEWLRLDVTVGMPIGHAVGLGIADGFSWATEDELNDLLDQFFAVYGGDPGSRAGDFIFNDPITVGVEAAWYALFGLTLSLNDRSSSLGFYDDGIFIDSGTSLGPLEPWYGFGSSPFYTTPGTFNAYAGLNVGEGVPDIGVFLVRDASIPMPEPTTLTILVLGLFGLSVILRRKV